MTEQSPTPEQEPDFVPITISMVDDFYLVTRPGHTDAAFTSFDDLTDFLASTVPEIKEEQ